MILKGVFHVSFYSQVIPCQGSAIAVLSGDGRIYGGNHLYVFVGTVTRDKVSGAKGEGQVNLTVSRHAGEPDKMSKLGDKFQVSLQGDLSQYVMDSQEFISFTMRGHVVGDESIQFGAQGRKIDEVE